MRKLLQINVTANWGSTGKIAEDIGCLLIKHGWESWIAYSRGKPESKSRLIRIGSKIDMQLHGLQTRLFDNHGLASGRTTNQFISRIKEINPDIIHLHNIHGYYLNYPILFDYLKKWGGPVVWTLHDCWPFTGHCAYYDFVGCHRWQSHCLNCPQLSNYPASFWKDRSFDNYIDKQSAFLNCPNLTLIPVSDWLNNELSKSFLSGYKSITIHNGINIDTFRPKISLKNYYSESKTILGVASVWDRRKGFEEFVKLRKQLPPNYRIVLVGLSKRQISELPEGITGIQRTDNVEQLVDLYNSADVFVNPTLEDNFPTTNLEALACGTPVITYQTGGSIEAVSDNAGFIVPKFDIKSLSDKIRIICENHPFKMESCRERAEKLYNKESVFTKYIELYTSLLS